MGPTLIMFVCYPCHVRASAQNVPMGRVIGVIQCYPQNVPTGQEIWRSRLYNFTLASFDSFVPYERLVGRTRSIQFFVPSEHLVLSGDCFLRASAQNVPMGRVIGVILCYPQNVPTGQEICEVEIV